MDAVEKEADQIDIHRAVIFVRHLVQCVVRHERVNDAKTVGIKFLTGQIQGGFGGVGAYMRFFEITDIAVFGIERGIFGKGVFLLFPKGLRMRETKVSVYQFL